VLLLVLVAVFGSTLTTVTIAVGVVSLAGAGAADPRRISVVAQPRIRAAAGRSALKTSSSFSARSCPTRCRRCRLCQRGDAVAILLESALAFLRLFRSNVASWGNLIGLGRDVLRVQ